MGTSKKKIKDMLYVIIGIVFMLGNALSLQAQVPLTQEEKNYIDEVKIIKAVSSEGTAPFQYTNKKGVVGGISTRILKEISGLTGLVFEYELYDSLEELFASDYDLIFGISSSYTRDELVLSPPYLKTETILYINSAVNSNELENKTYAAIEGGSLPEGIKEENAFYYKTREEGLDAVESGKADYGYGNAYSVAFYTLRNGYKNIVTIPKGKESREYSIGIPKENIEVIKLPLINGESGSFKVVSSKLYDDKGKKYAVVGKLIDISTEVAEKKDLVTRAQVDGLTGLYNATTTKQLIASSMKNNNKDQIDALVIMDCDDFKSVNDTFGHLAGDKVLEDLSIALKSTFRETDIIGRIGGDEFSVYMRDVQSTDIAVLKCQEVNALMQEGNEEFYVSLSAGIALLKEGKTYDELYKKADDALYEAKKKGGGQVCVSSY